MTASRRAVALATALSLSACMVGPNYQRPPPADPPTPEFKETTGPVIGAAADFRPAMPRDAIDRGPWWTMYGDPTLDQLSAQIDISNQTLTQAEAAYRQARALVRQDTSGLYPTVSGNAGFTQSGSGTGAGRSTQGGVVSTGTGSLSQYTAGPSLDWQIDLWGRIRRQIESDSAAAQASAADLANARLSAQANRGDQLFLDAHLRAAHPGLPGIGGGLHALRRDRAEPARRRHRLARRPGAGADPARADARPARRREHQPRASSSMPSRC